MKSNKSPGYFLLKPTDAVLSRNSLSINGTDKNNKVKER